MLTRLIIRNFKRFADVDIELGSPVWCDADMAGLLGEMADWARGNLWEQRAAAAALCEPRLLKLPEHAAAVPRFLDAITARLARPLGFAKP